MARALPDLTRASKMHVIDPKTLGQDGDGEEAESPELHPDTGLPTTIRAFVVVKDPRMVVIPNFFSEAECQHLIELVDGYWMPSLVGQATYSSDEDYSKGNLENMLSKTRTSWSCMLRYAQTSAVEHMEHRIASLAGLPVEHLERLNMVRYAPGELFNEHHDGKFRPKTVFVYLNDLPEEDEAGDTFFPLLGLSFRPRRGTAVMWSNVVLGEDEEDPRMLHAGRAPTIGIKYGVNCFFNTNRMRMASAVGAEVGPDQAEQVRLENLRRQPVAPSGDSIHERAEGEGCTRACADCAPGDPSTDESKGPPPVLTAYALCSDPRLVAIPGLLSEHEVQHLLDLALANPAPCPVANSGIPGAGLLHGGTEVLCTLGASETPTVEKIEYRVAACGGLAFAHLARLRVVRPGSRAGLSNRGCGPKSGYVCLCDSEEVFFVHLGLRLVLNRGDALMWPNVDWSTGKAVEDLRTLRRHLVSSASDTAGSTGLDIFFHDNPIREQQTLRQFVIDDDFMLQKAAD